MYEPKRKYKPSQYDREKWSLNQMADYLQLTPQRILQIVKKYDIPTFKHQRKTYLTPDAADDVLLAWKAGRVAWKINHEEKYVERLKKQKERIYAKFKQSNIDRASRERSGNKTV